ncbi:MAG: hypothetical protein IJK42_10445 [Prevotella sp.]|nr:hypothetical protein [Prevotella sp.]
MTKDNIEIIDAQENNLKHVNVEIPKGRLVVLAGVSGSSDLSDFIQWQQLKTGLFLKIKYETNNAIITATIPNDDLGRVCRYSRHPDCGTVECRWKGSYRRPS